MKKDFIAYEYKEVSVNKENISFYIDCYKNFGFEVDETSSKTLLKLKRDRKIINKTELTRLERNFEACVNEINALKRNKTTLATTCALIVGVIGTAFMAGAVFAVTHNLVWLCVLLAVPAFIGWLTPIPIYRKLVMKQTSKIQPLIEEKQEEIYTLCEKGHSLL
ncbi:MAG: hypothetical protein ACRCW1_01355 [Anaerotignaceae bacterium]